jgi:hypothetical protein
MTTMASAGVSDSDAQLEVAEEPLGNLAIGEGDDGLSLGPELDSAVLPLAAPPDSAPDDEDDDEPLVVDRADERFPEPVEIAVEESKPASVEAQPPAAAPPSASPWNKEEEPQAADAEKAPKPLPKAMAAIIIIVTAVVVMVIGVMILRQNATVGPPPSLPSGDASGAKKKPRTKPSAKPAAPKSSAKTSSSGAASAAPSGAVAPPEVDASKLPATMGYITVVYAPDKNAIVSALGKDIGKVGVPNQVTCTRPVFIRLKNDRGIWLNTGQPVNVKCQDVTTVEVK